MSKPKSPATARPTGLPTTRRFIASVTTLQGNVVSLRSDVTTLQRDVSTLDTRVSSAGSHTDDISPTGTLRHRANGDCEIHHRRSACVVKGRVSDPFRALRHDFCFGPAE